MKTNHLKNASDLLKDAESLISQAIKKGSVSSIEQDLILEKLRNAYDLILFERDQEKQPVAQPVLQPTKISVERTPEISVQPKEPEVKPQGNRINLIETKQPETKKEPLAKPQVKKDEGKGSSDEPEVQVEKEIPKQKTKPISFGTKQPTEIISDKYQGTRKFRNEALTDHIHKKDLSTKMQSKPISDLTKAIGVNDKFLFIKELFNGDTELYNNSIKKLNQFTDISEAMIFIHENFSWKGDSETANRFIELIRRKLLNE